MKSWHNKTDRVLMYFVCLLSFIFSISLSAQNLNQDQKEMDQILRKELGINPESKLKNETPTNEDKKEVKEENPIQERYAENAEDSPSATWILLKILFVLVILVGAGYFLVQKMQLSKAARYPVKGFMKVLSTLSLTPTQSVQIVEVGSRLLVLGVADGSVSLISEITSLDEKTQISKMKEEADPYTPNFLETLLESLQSKANQKKIRINKNLLESNELSSDLDVQKKTREGLERLRKHRELLEGGS
ncbi:MAG: flagellar biosynthetic protein FliO [Leptospira sp.]|nr:flagellar biosynthetic protein FliO [Leptospira sp.]